MRGVLISIYKWNFKPIWKGASQKKLYVGKEGNWRKTEKKEKTGFVGKTTDQLLYMFTDLYSRILNW